MEEFYVYVFFDTRKYGKYKYGEYVFDYEPFYVGKGKGDRFKEIYGKRRNLYFNNKAKKIERESEIGLLSLKVFEGTETDCLRREVAIINTIGRIDLGMGPLTNLTAGGEGITGLIFSEEHKKKLSISKSGSKNPMFDHCFTSLHKERMSKARSGKDNHFFGKFHTEETRWKMKNTWKTRAPVSLETKEKLSKASKGRAVSVETRRKLSIANKGQIPWIKGKHHSEKTKMRMSIASRRHHKEEMYFKQVQEGGLVEEGISNE